MTDIDALMNELTDRAGSAEVRAVSYFLGECCTRRDLVALERGYDRLRQLRGTLPPDVWLRGCVDALTAQLDGYFARLEPTLRIEALVREVEEQPLWQDLLASLAVQTSNQETLRAALAQQGPASKSTISVALEDLRLRELVEHVPSPSRRERIHALTMRGREVVAAAQLAPRRASEPTAATAATDATPPSRRGRRSSGGLAIVAQTARTSRD